jgi:hypothetical protein
MNETDVPWGERIYTPRTNEPGGVCTICGDLDPVHVHDGERRIEDYFVVGRGQTDFSAARYWKRRALQAERKLAGE